jgi:hypothetical protein
VHDGERDFLCIRQGESAGAFALIGGWLFGEGGRKTPRSYPPCDAPAGQDNYSPIARGANSRDDARGVSRGKLKPLILKAVVSRAETAYR